jgi:hypothetical protein
MGILAIELDSAMLRPVFVLVIGKSAGKFLRTRSGVLVIKVSRVGA